MPFKKMDIFNNEQSYKAKLKKTSKGRMPHRGFLLAGAGNQKGQPVHTDWPLR